MGPARKTVQPVFFSKAVGGQNIVPPLPQSTGAGAVFSFFGPDGGAGGGAGSCAGSSHAGGVGKRSSSIPLEPRNETLAEAVCCASRRQSATVSSSRFAMRGRPRRPSAARRAELVQSPAPSPSTKPGFATGGTVRHPSPRRLKRTPSPFIVWMASLSASPSANETSG